VGWTEDVLSALSPVTVAEGARRSARSAGNMMAAGTVRARWLEPKLRTEPVGTQETPAIFTAETGTCAPCLLDHDTRIAGGSQSAKSTPGTQA